MSRIDPFAALSTTLRGSLNALLGAEKTVNSEAEVCAIRQAMLDLHGATGRDLNPRFQRRLTFLYSAEDLWYARVELFSDLCRLHDESHAVRALESLLPLFRGRIPDSLLQHRAPGGSPQSLSRLRG